MTDPDRFWPLLRPPCFRARASRSFDPGLVRDLIRNSERAAGLSSLADRVPDVLELMTLGMSDRGIAAHLFVSGKTADFDIPLDELGSTALEHSKSVRISTTCTVFAESEVLSWLGKGKKIEDILWGVHQSIAGRSAGLLRRVGIEEQVSFTGGVTRNIAMIEALEEKLGVKLNVSEDSHYMGALGAALFAMDHILASRSPHDNVEAKS